MKPISIQEWTKMIDWSSRVKAVCKPCWELKYCPYGPLVEQFTLKKERDSESCRIFGHDCPVFYVAEPFSETRELRNISRTIPSKTKYRVLSRDRYICQNCKKNVPYEEIEFDHIIPISKGGSSDENNIHILCKDCNRKKSNSYERDNLIYHITEQTNKEVPIEFIMVFIDCIKEKHKINKELKREIEINDILKVLEVDEISRPAEHAHYVTLQIHEFFNSPKPREISQKLFNALKFRWGFTNGRFNKIEETVNEFGVEIDDLLKIEMDLMRRLGHKIRSDSKTIAKWKKL